MVEERISRAITDSNGRQVPMAIVRALPDIEKCRVVGEAVDFDMQLMRLIEEDGSISERAAASALRSNKSRVHRALGVLKTDKLIKREARKWKITNHGAEWMKHRNRGV